VIVYMIHHSLCKVIVWVQDGLITIPTTLNIRFCNDGLVNHDFL
jgi:hypothetical protein